MNRLLTLLLDIALAACILPAASAQATDFTEAIEDAAFIDRIVAEGRKAADQKQRSAIDDYTFCRRIYIDAIGRIPTIDELDQFIQDDRANKRTHLIAHLLESKGYQSHWFNYWAIYCV